MITINFIPDKYTLCITGHAEYDEKDRIIENTIFDVSFEIKLTPDTERKINIFSISSLPLSLSLVLIGNSGILAHRLCCLQANVQDRG